MTRAMKEACFQAALADKYNIHEEFSAVGNFVAYPEFNREPTGLVSIGLSSRSLVVARMLLTGDTVDYELISLTPVSLLALFVQNYAKRQIAVDIPFKPKTWIYQLCTGEDQDKIWELFMLAIKKSYDRTYVGSAGSGDREPGAAIIIPSGACAMIPPCLGRGVKRNVSRTQARRSASLPDVLSKSVHPNNEDVARSQSLESLYEHVKFDKFVNEDPTPVMADLNISSKANGPRGTSETAFGRLRSSFKQMFRWNS